MVAEHSCGDPAGSVCPVIVGLPLPTSGWNARCAVTKPLVVQIAGADFAWTPTRFGTVHVGGAVGSCDGVGMGVDVGTGVCVGVAGGAVGPTVGSTPPPGVPAIAPLRIGNDADALTGIELPRRLLISGGINEKRRVIETMTGEPISVPLGKEGVGVAGNEQLLPPASAVIRRANSVWAAAFAGACHAYGFSDAKFAASRAAFVSVTQPRKTRPKSTPKRIRSRTTGAVIANSTRLWPRGSRQSRRPVGR